MLGIEEESFRKTIIKKGPKVQQKTPIARGIFKKIKDDKKFYYQAVDGFEPTIKLLQSRALPLGYTAITDTILSKKKRFVKSLSSN